MLARCGPVTSVAAGTPHTVQKRDLNVHEYVGIKVMGEAGISVPTGFVASNSDEVESIVAQIAEQSGSEDVVVKAQVLAGGRGKGKFKNGFQGGVHIATS